MYPGLTPQGRGQHDPRICTRYVSLSMEELKEEKMSYLVFCTFDLKNANVEYYQNAYADLERIDLKKVATSSQGNNVVIPTTAAIGTFNGANASAVCTDIRNRVQSAFKARGFKSEVFVVTGGDWAWVPGTT
jgi:hypothetical protein